MAKRAVHFIQGGHYHIYNRGANRQPIFKSDENYVYLLRQTKEAAHQHNIVIIAYCLMPNHYHYVVRQDGEEPMSLFVQTIFNSCTKAFNKMWDRSGTLLEGPFKSIHITSDEYLLHLCRYVHLNPVEAGLVNQPERWAYSNCAEWLGLRNGTLVDRKFVLDNFPTPKAYRKFLADAPPKHIERAVRGLAFDDE
jgi:REP element-mobilizing transposase RayT